MQFEKLYQIIFQEEIVYSSQTYNRYKKGPLRGPILCQCTARQAGGMGKPLFELGVFFFVIELYQIIFPCQRGNLKK